MTGISTTHDIRGELARQHYSVVSADAISLSPEMQTAWQSLLTDYDKLPVDEYLPDGGKYRFRRYGRYHFTPQSGALLPLPHVDYYQSVDINRVTGGVVRKFAPLLPETFANPFLQALIRFDFAQFPLDLSQYPGAWQVDVHEMRVLAEVGAQGEPTPEGVHRDGAVYVTVHLAELQNVTGGEVSIYDDDQNLLKSFTLRQVMDAYLFHDAVLWHAASPIHSADGVNRGVRSILTFDYHYRPELEKLSPK